MRHTRALVVAAIVAALCARAWRRPHAASPSTRSGSRIVRCARPASTREPHRRRSPSTCAPGQTVFAAERRRVAPSGVGREARGLVHRAARARPALSLPHRGRRRRRRGRDVSWNGNLCLVGFGDPDAHARRPRTGSRAGSRRPGSGGSTGRVLGDDTHFDTRRDALGWKPSYLGIESRPLSALSVGGRPVRRRERLGRGRSPGVHGGARERGASPSTDALARAAPERTPLPIAFDLSQRLAHIVPLMNARQRQLRRRDAPEGARRDDRRARLDGGRRTSRPQRRCAGAGVPLAGVRIADGSGLSRFDRVTVRGARRHPPRRSSRSVDRRRLRLVARRRGSLGNAEGTTRHAPDPRPHSSRRPGRRTAPPRSPGFVRDRYVFAILHNGSPVPYWTARAAQDRFVTVLARS